VTDRSNDLLASAKERAWRELADIDAALSAGLIDEEEWHAQVLAVVEPSYLAATTPQGQSGHSGDAARWELARRLLLDGVDRDGTFLDVGCANGFLMESLAVGLRRVDQED
jgi:2-polyprenyl-3-methyl-5-hydroxy-6-metoxy-1,4-benzoquinol methylase